MFAQNVFKTNIFAFIKTIFLTPTFFLANTSNRFFVSFLPQFIFNFHFFNFFRLLGSSDIPVRNTVCCEPVFSLIRAMTIIHCWNCFIDFNGLSYDGWANCPYFFTARTIFWGFGGLQKGSKQPRNAYVAISGSGSSKSATQGGSWLDQDRGHTCWYVGIFFPFWHCHQGAPKGLKTAPKCHK